LPFKVLNSGLLLATVGHRSSRRAVADVGIRPITSSWPILSEGIWPR